MLVFYPIKSKYKLLFATALHSDLTEINCSRFPNDTIDTSRLKEFAEDNFKFDENSGKFSERVENPMGKGEIAHYEQYLLFPQRFSEDFYCRKKKNLFGGGFKFCRVLFH